MNPLVQALKANDLAQGKKATHYFDNNASVISYSTGFPTLDYYLGYNVNVFDKDGVFVESYPNLGITAGSYVLFIGKSGTGKTSTATKIASNIVRPFRSGFVMHFDLEQSMNYSRLQSLTGLPMDEIEEGKYILRQELTTLEDMKSAIMKIYKEKMANPDAYKYNTHKLNEFGEEIIIFEPTVVIIDSIASITTAIEDNVQKRLEEIGSQTEQMRLAGEIGRFFRELLPYLRTANINIIAINQIKDNPQTSFIKKPGLILGLSPDEAIPGGKGPIYYAQILLKFVAVGSEKYKEEEDGFQGFKVRADIIKSRVSPALKSVNLIYDNNTGIDMVRSTVDYAKSLGAVTGNRNAYYFTNDKEKEHKFTLKSMPSDFKKDPKLYKYLYNTVIPSLQENLFGLHPEELTIDENEEHFYDLKDVK